MNSFSICTDAYVLINVIAEKKPLENNMHPGKVRIKTDRIYLYLAHNRFSIFSSCHYH